MMEKITRTDIVLIIKGALEMAHQDKNFGVEEKVLLKDLMEIGNISTVEVNDFQTISDGNALDYCNELSCEKAKKIFLLTQVTVILADNKVDISEKTLFDDLTKQLGVGKIHIKKHEFGEYKTVLKKMLFDSV